MYAGKQRETRLRCAPRADGCEDCLNGAQQVAESRSRPAPRRSKPKTNSSRSGFYAIVGRTLTGKFTERLACRVAAKGRIARC